MVFVKEEAPTCPLHLHLTHLTPPAPRHVARELNKNGGYYRTEAGTGGLLPGQGSILLLKDWWGEGRAFWERDQGRQWKGP